MRKVAVLLLLLLAVGVVGAPAKKKKLPSPVAPATFPHPMAMFFGSLSNQGTRTVAFKATAVGTRFFFEEPSVGVTVYRFVNGEYVKEEFLRGSSLAKATKKYATK